MKEQNFIASSDDYIKISIVVNSSETKFNISLKIIIVLYILCLWTLNKVFYVVLFSLIGTLLYMYGVSLHYKCSYKTLWGIHV